MFHANIVGRFAGAFFRIPRISAVHTIERGTTWHLSVDRLTRWLITKETVVCKAAKEFMMENTHIKENKIRVINNGVDVEACDMQVNIAEIKKKYVLPEGKKVIGTVASLTKPKAQSTLIRSAKRVFETLPDSILVIVGSGPEKEKLDLMVKEMAIENNVFFIDHVLPVCTVLKIFDCFVLTSDWEGVPVSLLEAMAVKIPVVVTEAGGMPDVITNKIEGYCVPVGNDTAIAEAIINVFSDNESAKNFAEAAFKKLKREFVIDRMIAETCLLYEVC